MILTFNIEYRTNWGEEVRITGSVPELGDGEQARAFALHTTDGITWSAPVELQKLPEDKLLHYTYFIFKDGVPVRREWNVYPRTLLLASNRRKTYTVNDCWKNIPEQLYLYSSAFTKSLMPRIKEPAPLKHFKKSIVLKAYCPRLNSDYALAICGNQKILGDWNPEKALLMSDVAFPEWQVEIDEAKLVYPLEYKFVLYNLKEKRVEAWETNPNRYVPALGLNENETYVISDRHVHFDLPAWKGAGVAIPVFSLKSESSFGIGDFGDLRKMVDWAILTRQKVVQILPINDTTMTHTWMDSYPYNGISIYALHPMYIDLSRLEKLKDKRKRDYFAGKQQELNAYPFLNYEKVDKLKWEYMRLLFEQEGSRVLVSDEYRKFFEKNREWLIPYAAYCYLRDIHNTSDFQEWEEYAVYDKQAIEELCAPDKPEFPQIAIHYYIQYILHVQLSEASDYARKNGVVLKGDIPIGISRCSVEAWTEPYYFNMNGQAGAPPDDFSVNGQNWGFPTYNWDVMEQDGYRWWMKRFRKMAEYFDAYRIDHILGFFRIWEIPTHSVYGLLGQFVPSLPMTREEIENYGLKFDEENFLQPYIHEHLLQQVFGPHAERVKEHFLRPIADTGRYRIRSEFDTQRKVEAYFYGKTDGDSIWIREGLYSLISNVLFLRDSKEYDKYHPRISVQNEPVYQALSEADKAAFNRLYEQYYYHRHNDFWYERAMKKLPELTQSTRMLVCGEDLGMIPGCVPDVMKELQILSLEIQRMPKEAFQEFGHLERYPYLSVCTISTHDMSTVRGWWKEDYQQTQRYYNSILGYYGQAPVEATAGICESIIKQHLRSNSMLCILSWQDWLSLDGHWRNPDVEAERINIPANPRHYWRYRMHLTLEELMKADSLNEKIRTLIELAERNPKK